MSNTNIDQLRISGGDMKEGDKMVSINADVTSSQEGVANRDKQLNVNNECADECNVTDGVSGGNGSKESISNSSRVTKKTSKKKKNTCYLAKCSNPASKFIGDCNFCKGHFCSKHRLMENHACEGLTSCKEVMHKRNADKLAAEQTRAPKIQI